MPALKQIKQTLLLSVFGLFVLVLHSNNAKTDVISRITPFNTHTETLQQSVVLQNDSFQDQAGQGYLQLGFIKGEMAAVRVKVPASIPYFKVDYFRVFVGNQYPASTRPNPLQNLIVYFQMDIANQPSPGIGRQIDNAATITPGPYWNDIPAQGASGSLPCVRAGQFIGAALEFTHNGAPSVYRDTDGLSAVNGNSIFAIPGGWNYSVSYGVEGDWILRIVGHPATADECR